MGRRCLVLPWSPEDGAPTAQNNLHHSHHDGEGQNAFMAKPAGSPTDAVQSWYDEIKDWDFSTSKKKGGVTGHFTQVGACEFS